MSRAPDRYAYRGYGLEVRSEIELPELLPSVGTARADLTVRVAGADEAAVRPTPGRELADHDFVPAIDGGYVLRVPAVGLFGVREGREIAVLPDPEATEGYLRLFLIGSAFGMALHQRGLLVMHGATVLTPAGTAAIFVGHSGAGKSTLAAALGQRGHAILGDDTMALWPGADGFRVWPGSRMFKLWQASLDHLGEPAAPLLRIENRTDKFYWPNRALAPDRPVRVSELVQLVGAPPGSAPAFSRLGGIEALRLVAENTYRPGYVRLLGREPEHFRQCAALASSLTVGRLSRPRDFGRLADGLCLLEEEWRRQIGLAALSG